MKKVLLCTRIEVRNRTDRAVLDVVDSLYKAVVHSSSTYERCGAVRSHPAACSSVRKHLAGRLRTCCAAASRYRTTCISTVPAVHTADNSARMSHGFSYTVNALYANAAPRYAYFPHVNTWLSLLFLTSCTPSHVMLLTDHAEPLCAIAA
jgi:hypothetical protein